MHVFTPNPAHLCASDLCASTTRALTTPERSFFFCIQYDKDENLKFFFMEKGDVGPTASTIP